MLAHELGAYADRADVLLLALPRGGVPVASVIARMLHLPLDVFVVRKLGLPDFPELAMGAVARGGVRALNTDVVENLRVPANILDEVTTRELAEVERRELAYRNGRPFPSVEGRTIILVDDGIATGSTMMAGMTALRQMDAGKIVVAAPVIASSTYAEIARAADEVATALVSDEFGGIGSFYEDFSQVTDEEVREFLGKEEPHASPLPNE